MTVNLDQGLKSETIARYYDMTNEHFLRGWLMTITRDDGKGQ